MQDKSEFLDVPAIVSPKSNLLLTGRASCPGPSRETIQFPTNVLSAIEDRVLIDKSRPGD
jgi:hypothetical protein